MRISTFNINGIKARIEALPRWLTAFSPDVVCLQEIKSVSESFPTAVFEDMGYNVRVFGQKSFNGVAILSRYGIDSEIRGLPGDADDAQARWIEALILSPHPVRVCNLYLPNGNPAPGPKYDYKLAWMARMQARVRQLLAEEEPFVCLGDYNVISQPADAAHPEKWTEDALFLPQTRQAYWQLLHLGLTDAIRALFPHNTNLYSFWDYQERAFEKNNGICIDRILLSPQAADRLKDGGIEKDVRAGDRPSDHVPVWVELEA